MHIHPHPFTHTRPPPTHTHPRVWMDGAFDMMHYGHMNAFRQAKALGTKLIVGMNSDESMYVYIYACEYVSACLSV